MTRRRPGDKPRAGDPLRRGFLVFVAMAVTAFGVAVTGLAVQQVSSREFVRNVEADTACLVAALHLDAASEQIGRAGRTHLVTGSEESRRKMEGAVTAFADAVGQLAAQRERVDAATLMRIAHAGGRLEAALRDVMLQRGQVPADELVALLEERVGAEREVLDRDLASLVADQERQRAATRERAENLAGAGVSLLVALVVVVTGLAIALGIALRGNVRRQQAYEEHLRREEERQRYLAMAGEALTHSLEPTEVRARLLDLSVPRIADWGVLDLFLPDAVVLGGLLHADPAKEPLLRELRERFPPDPSASGGAGEVARSGRARIAEYSPEALERHARSDEHRALLEALGARSCVIVPLSTSEGVLGTLTYGRVPSSPPFTPADCEMLGEFARRGAIALENARLVEMTRLAKDRTERLQQVTAALARANTIEEVAQALVDVGFVALGVTRGSVTRIVGHRLEMVRSFGYPEALNERWRNRALASVEPAAQVAADGAALWVTSFAEYARLFPNYIRTLDGEETGARAILPLNVHGVPVGLLWLTWQREWQFTAAEKAFMTAVATLGGQTLERVIAAEQLAHLHEKTAEALRHSRDAARFSDTFVGILGHDLRNPLAAIASSADLALRRTEDDRLVRPLKRIEQSTERMARMIDQILDFTRVRLGGGIPLKRVRFTFGELVRDVLDELRTAHPTHEFRVDVRGATEGRWDADRLAQVVSNLAGNAIEHGTGTRVEVLLDGTDPARIVLRVSNEGAIAPDVLPTLFDPFRGAARRDRAPQGLGLGLYIAREVVGAHGGEVVVDSSAEHGTSFTITLPREPGEVRQAS